MSLINCDINLTLVYSDKCILSNDTKETTFAITDAKPFALGVTLSTQYDAKLLQQLKLGFRKTIN